MIQKSLKQIGILTFLLSASVLVFSGPALGEKMFAAFSSADSDIFPFSAGETADPVATKPSTPSVSNDGFTDKLYEVTEQGIKDPNGNLLPVVPGGVLDTVTPLPSGAVTPGLPGSGEASNSFEEYQASIISNWGGKRAYTQKRLEDIKKSLQDEQIAFDKLGKKARHLQKALIPVQQRKETLDGEIDLLNSQINESKSKIRNAEFQIADAQITLKGLISSLSQSETELNIQRKAVLEYILLVYREDERFRDIFNNGSTTFKLLLADSSVSENLLGQEYASILEKTGREVFYSMHLKKLVLEEKRNEIQETQAEMEGLNKSLNDERRIMEENRLAKQDLLEQTQGEEERFQQLLEESLKQQLESAIQIQNMKDNVDFIEQKLKVLDDSLVQAQQMATDQTQLEKLKEADSTVSQIDPLANEGDSPSPEVAETPTSKSFFKWPVPALAVTAYFHDETYPKKWGIHQALDIRAKQFTEIKAPANAYVFQAKDNGKGYSYIILAHKNKFVTVYGHVTQIMVKAGDTVKEGDVIGLTGGTPGTPGAGWQTTGPHLHFEVWHNGVQTDPLEFLPIEMLPLEYIPDKYLNELVPIIPQKIINSPT